MSAVSGGEEPPRTIAVTPLDVGLSRRDLLEAIRVVLVGLDTGATLEQTLDHLKSLWLGKR